MSDANSKSQICFIGLGAMGSAIAFNFTNRGRPLAF